MDMTAAEVEEIKQVLNLCTIEFPGFLSYSATHLIKLQLKETLLLQGVVLDTRRFGDGQYFFLRWLRGTILINVHTSACP